MATPIENPELDAAVGRLIRHWAFFEDALLQVAWQLGAADAGPAYRDRLIDLKPIDLFREARRLARGRQSVHDARRKIDEITLAARPAMRSRMRVAHAPTGLQGEWIYGLSDLQYRHTQRKIEKRHAKAKAEGWPPDRWAKEHAQLVKASDAILLTTILDQADELKVFAAQLTRLQRELFGEEIGYPDELFPGLLDRQGRLINPPTG